MNQFITAGEHDDGFLPSGAATPESDVPLAAEKSGETGSSAMPYFPPEFSQGFTPPPEKPTNKKGTLYVVSSPIGNAEDITLRALKILKMADIVVGEEGKTVARLLHEHRITKKLEELNEHNEASQTGALLNFLQQGKSLALVSDAGTPLLADPGGQLVRKAIERGIRVKAVPGATSIMAALITSGLPMDSFVFAGFVSREPSERLQELKRLAEEPRTVVLLETPYRLVPLLEAARQIMPTRRAYLGCNLTMDAETHHYGTVSELYTKFVVMRFKGEFVFCFEGTGKSNANKSSTNKQFSRSSLPDKRSPKHGESRREGRFDNRSQPQADSKNNRYGGDKQRGERQSSERQSGERQGGERRQHNEAYKSDRPSRDKKFSKERSAPRGQGFKREGFRKDTERPSRQMQPFHGAKKDEKHENTKSGNNNEASGEAAS